MRSAFAGLTSVPPRSIGLSVPGHAASAMVNSSPLFMVHTSSAGLAGVGSALGVPVQTAFSPVIPERGMELVNVH